MHKRRVGPLVLLLAAMLVMLAPTGLPARARATAAPAPAVDGERLFVPIALRDLGQTVDLEPRLPYLALDAIDVRSYDVRLSAPAPGRVDIQIVTVVTLSLRRAGDYVDLQLEPEAIKVRRVAVDKRPVGFALIPGMANDYALTGTRLRVPLGRTLPAGATVAIEISYAISTASLAHDRGFYYRADFHGSRVLTTRSWPYYARYWLPGNDHPADPATATFELHVPPDMVGAASGRLVAGDYVAGSGLDGDGLRIFRWSQDVPIVTYDFNITIGELAVFTDEICFEIDTVNDDRVPCETANHRLPLVYYYPPALESLDAFLTEIQKAADATIFYSSLFELYPYEKLGWATAPHPFNQEHVGLITLVSPGAAVHEAVHSWWGNTVYIAHWGDLWISEGITTYFTGYYDEYLSGRNTACMSTENRLNYPPDADLLAFYSLTPYCKGAAAVHDLRQRMAEATGLTIDDEAARAAFLATMVDLYDTYRFDRLGTLSLIAFLRANLERHYQAYGFEVRPEVVDAMIDDWAATWFVLDDGAGMAWQP